MTLKRKAVLLGAVGLSALAMGLFVGGSLDVSAHSDKRGGQNVQPYIVSLKTVLANPDGQTRSSMQRWFARRGDGATVEIRASVNGKVLGDRIILDPGSQTRTGIDELTHSKTTYNLAKSGAEPELMHTPCPGRGRAELIQGIAAYKTESDWKLRPGRSLHTTRWVAPLLGCLVLRERQEVRENGQVRGTASTDATSVVMGEPPSALFVVPAYHESAPSDVLREAAQREGRHVEESTLKAVDRAYFAAQTRR